MGRADFPDSAYICIIMQFPSGQLTKYDINYRIVANKCKTQQIESSQFKKYKIKWKDKLKYKVNLLEESI